MSSLYKQQLNTWKSTLDVKAHTVIDIGGAQDPIKGKTKSWEVENYLIMDLETPHVLTQSPDLVQDMNEPLTHKVKADLVFMLGVMDYVINPNIAMQNIHDLLAEGGEAWIEWPLFYGHHEPLMEEGCRYSEGCIHRLIKQANLKLVEMIRKPAGNDNLIRFMREDGQRLSKNYQYHDTVGFITKVSK